MYVDGVELFLVTHSSFPSANISATFEPPAGHPSFDYVFDFTGEIRHDRTEMVLITFIRFAGTIFSSFFPDSN